MAETVPGYASDIWYGVLVPAATPASLVKTLNTEIARQLNSADARARLAADGTEVVANTPAEFATLLRTEYARWGKLIRDAGLQAE